MKSNLNRIHAAAAAASALFISVAAMAQNGPTSIFPLPVSKVSTIPSNGDVNPYGVAFIPNNFAADGTLQPGDVLVSNFNNNQNLQGTGTTIIRVNTAGDVSTFFQGKAPLGLTAALGTLNAGYVFVGNLPTADGTSATVQPGSILVLSRNGELLGAIADPHFVNGPWGMAIHDFGGGRAVMFTSNVLDGTVVRFDLAYSTNGLNILDVVQVGSGFNHRVDPAALVLGPSGLFFDAPHETLYVASSADNAVYGIPDAATARTSQGTGKLVYSDNTHLHGPLDLVMLSNGHLVVANSDGSNVDPNQPSELVEFAPNGTFIAQYSVDPNNGGAFGVGVSSIGGGFIRFAAVDDNANALTIWTTSPRQVSKH